MRITIVGHSGSGKTTLARYIAERFDIPHLHLDRLWFEAGGHLMKPGEESRDKERVRNTIKEQVEVFIAQTQWVSDGLYPRVQEAIAEQADHIVFIDIPLWRRLMNHAVRIWRTDRHKELSFWNELAFFPDMIRRNYAHDPKLRAVVKRFEGKVMRLRSYKEVSNYLDWLSTDPL